MIRKPANRFLYKAHAVGVSGTFTRPRAEFLEAQASCALPVDGGIASARVENFNFRDIVSFRSAFTQAVGAFDPESGSWNTLVTSTIEGLNVQNVVTADRIVARLASHHFADGREASILTLGSHFENLRVAGQPVRLEPDTRLIREWDTLSKAREGCAGRKASVVTGNGAMVAASIFHNVTCAGGVDPADHSIHFPELGSIHLGEIIISDGERRLTMMRIAFGCVFDGDCNLGEVGGNGHQLPPF